MNYTSIEQSKKLLELGLSPESADMIYNPQMDIDGNCASGFVNHPEIYPYKDIIHSDKNLYLPCWSLGALLEVMPHTGLDGIELNNYSDAKTAWTAIFHWKAENTPIRIADTPLDAVYEIVVWLLENNYIKKEGNT